MRKYLSLVLLSAGIFVAASAQPQDTYRFDHGPYLQGLTKNSVWVYFTTSAKGVSWVEMRAEGADAIKRCRTIDDGLIEADNTENKIELSGMEPARSYQYRIVSVPILKFRLSNCLYGDTIRSDWHTFRTLDPKAKTCSFITTSDIHDDAGKYRRLLSYMPLEQTDMVFLLGDILSHFSHEGQPYTSFIDVSADMFAAETPFVLVRGNHDTRGHLARTYPRYIYRPDNHFYGTYRLGDTFIVLLDTGEDKPDSHIDYSGLTAFEDYRREQAEWLRKVIKSKEYRKAKRRIVLAHIPPIAPRENSRISAFTSEDLYREYLPILNGANVDLMICGHTHRFMLLEPEKEPAYKFPVLINDNRSISFVSIVPEGISVRTVNDQGEVTLERVF